MWNNRDGGQLQGESDIHEIVSFYGFIDMLICRANWLYPAILFLAGVTACHQPAREPHPGVPHPLQSGRAATSSPPEIVRYSDGTLKIVRSFVMKKDGEFALQGPYTEYHENGRIKLEGVYEVGLRHGVFNRFQPDGTRTLSRRYRKDQLDGLYRAWDSNGRLIWELNYTRGVPHGRFTSFHSNGMRRSEGTVIRGAIHGLYRVFDEHGKVVRHTYYNLGQRTLQGD